MEVNVSKQDTLPRYNEFDRSMHACMRTRTCRSSTTHYTHLGARLSCTSPGGSVPHAHLPWATPAGSSQPGGGRRSGGPTMMPSCTREKNRQSVERRETRSGTVSRKQKDWRRFRLLHMFGEERGGGEARLFACFGASVQYTLLYRKYCIG